MKVFYKIIFLCLLNIINLSNLAYAKKTTEYSASSVELTFNSHGKRMSGFIYQAAGIGPHPTVLLLHGYPGNEKNLDVSQALRKQGFNVVFFHYTGAWGSEGEFSFLNAEEDVQTVLNYMNINAADLRIDKRLISIVGHSMGGHMAIAGILDNPSVKCAIAYDGANLGVNDVGMFDDPETTIPWKEYSNSLFMLNGWSGKKAEDELKKYSKDLNLVRRVNSLKGRPVLLIPASTDVIPMKSHIKPLFKALKQTNNSKISYKLIDDDHSFNSSRDELIQTSIKFLHSNCK